MLGGVLLIIDNYDSFTWNLVQRVGELDADCDMRVVRNDKITTEEAQDLQPSHVILSPGPCTPTESGICQRMVEDLGGRMPMLGVCLGHQAIAAANGMTVKRGAHPVHGKTSPIYHDGRGIFNGLPDPFEATRYHSLVVDPDTVGDDFEISAWTEDGICMGLRRRGDGAPLIGVQFHPESFLTAEGPNLLTNFLAMGA